MNIESTQFNINRIDSPALIVYEEIIIDNIRKAIEIAGGDVSRLRPHVKTNKTREICELMMHEGITKFKCATIAEAEMLAMAGALDILLAYQPVGPKIERLLRLMETWPAIRFACLTDNKLSAQEIDRIISKGMNPLVTLDVFIDVNTGMNRTGLPPSQVPDLAEFILSLKHVRLAGLHGYDGHIHETDLSARQQAADASFAGLNRAYQSVRSLVDDPLTLVTSGSITFPNHIRRENVECSPGTFVLWDYGYSHSFPDLPFRHAASILCRVVSVIDGQHICIDVGSKSVASESPLPRIYFPQTFEITPVAHNEEHLVAEVPDSSLFPVGTILYGIPKHICPTVALYEKMYVVGNNGVAKEWKVIARDRCITI
jgi:D-serine deaminase-like pyridoxal phosphate-dependent protein